MNLTKFEFPRRMYKASFPMQFAQVDLFDCLNDSYILTFVDVFSRKCELSPLKNKTKEEIKKGFEIIFHNLKKKPQYIQSDKESGIYALREWLDEQGINLYSVYGYHGYSCGIVERLHREMVELVEANHVPSNRIHNFLYEEFPKYHNNKSHSSLKGLTPNEVFNENIESNEVMEIQKEREEKLQEDVTQMRGYRVFNVGDLVRVLKPKQLFRKKFESYFYPDVYEIEEKYDTIPTTYKLKGIDTQKFYSNQLQKSTYKSKKSKVVITINDELNNNENDRIKIREEKTERKIKPNKILKGLIPSLDNEEKITTRSKTKLK